MSCLRLAKLCGQFCRLITSCSWPGVWLILLLYGIGCRVASGDQVILAADVAVLPLAAERTDSILTGQDLSIWSTVDSTGTNVEVIACLRRFFDRKLYDGADTQTFWLPSDFEHFTNSYPEIKYAEYDDDTKLHYYPTLLRIRRTARPGEHFATVKWAAVDATGTAADVKYVYTFLLRDSPEGLRLSTPTEAITGAWPRHQVGPIKYIVSPTRSFGESRAKEQLEELERLGDFFQIPLFPIDFYSCASTAEVMQIRGFDFHPLMYVHATGGMAELDNRVLSGNDSEVYTHEIVHLFMQRVAPRADYLLNEGLATYLGGSSGYSYAWHLAALARHLDEHPDFDLSAHINVQQQDFLPNAQTSVSYAVGAAICAKLLREQGREVLVECLKLEGDLWSKVADFGITKAGLRDVVRAEAAQTGSVVLPVDSGK